MVGSINGNSYQTSIQTQMIQKLFGMMDADGDGSISKTELQSLSDQEGSGIDAFFSNADSDESDAVSQQEFASALSKIFQESKSGSPEGRPPAGGPPPPPPDSSEMISSMDTDGDGYLSAEEMSAGGVRDAEKLFSEIDTDGDGLASQDELDAFAETMAAEGPKEMAGGPPPPPPDSSEMISSMDTDGDGYLSAEEMSSGGVRDAEKLFSEIDTDGDGLASQDELDAFAETLAAEGPKEMAGGPPPPPPESSDSDSEQTTSLQQELISKLVEMIAQNRGYSDFSAKGTSIFA